MNYISIITNFGCHYKCPYCIVKENNLHIPKTTLAGLNNLEETLKENRCNMISISGVGIVRKCHINGSTRPVLVEMHTSYMTDETSFPFYDCYRVVYHANSIDQLSHICRIGDEITRAVFVVTADYTIADIMDIALFVKNSSEIDELSFRQLVDDKYTEQHYLEEYLRMGHKKLWWYIEQNDYNLYYAENEVSGRYRDFEKEES